MQEIAHSIQRHNMNLISDYSFLVEFVNSPYAFSISFLKDKSIIGYDDPFG